MLRKGGQELIRQYQVVKVVNRFNHLSEPRFRFTVKQLISILSDDDLLKLYKVAVEHSLWGIARYCKQVLTERGISID